MQLSKRFHTMTNGEMVVQLFRNVFKTNDEIEAVLQRMSSDFDVLLAQTLSTVFDEMEDVIGKDEERPRYGSYPYPDFRNQLRASQRLKLIKLRNKYINLDSLE